MAWITPTPAELRARVRFERRAKGANLGGVRSTAWEKVGDDRSAKLEPTRGGEGVVADRVAGNAGYDLWVRFDSFTSTVTTEYRAVDVRSGETFAIKWIADPTRQRRWLIMQVVSEGR